MARSESGENIYARLRDIQARNGFISEDAVGSLSRELNLPLYHLQGLVSFYPTFRTKPKKSLTIRVCRDMSCHLAGSRNLFQKGLESARGSDDVEFCEVPCLGRCEQAVAAEINEKVYGGASEELLQKALKGQAPPPSSPQVFPQKNAQCDPYGTPQEHFSALRACLEGERKPEEVIAALKQSGIRGMGGAGFPTGLKWQIVRNAEGLPKYVVCNADESEPGTSKDRLVMERWPYLMIEGLLISMWVVGAEKGWVYIRHEYLDPAHQVEEAIQEARQRGLIGGNLKGAGGRFEVRVFESPGGYICGEETALLEAMEGRRAEPRNKPPFPGTHGLWSKPTVINNVETFAYVPAILHRGPQWFAEQGENGGKGLKFLALSGHVNRPGVYEVPMGITARRFIEEFGQGVKGGALKAFAPGGASSGFLPAAEADTPLEFKALADKGSMLGSGAVVVAAEGTDMVDLALNVLKFFRDESCGKCVPCREGTAKAVAMLENANARPLTPVIQDLAQAMALTSICGLGQAAMNPVLSVMRHWPEEWARVAGK